jgi:8-oxo-dGTP pyrophosphatase MutT (NUDIX family)
LASGAVARFTRNLVVSEPERKSPRFAGVSIIMKGGESPSVLLIKRAEHSGDPWSGQIAFPGGKMQPRDRTVKDAAVRETKEEVGIDLDRAAEFLGYAGTTVTHTGTMDVVPSVFLLKQAVEIRTNPEVASYRWVELKELTAPGAKSTYPLNFQGNVVDLPAYIVGDYLVWGLTYRIISTILEDQT